MPSSPESRQDEQTHIAEPEGPEQQPADGQEPAPSQAPRTDHEAELARLDDRYKRALADLDNYRKRAGREVERRVGEARESLLRDWLEVLDSVDRALAMDAPAPLAEGMRVVRDQMEAVLARQGVRRIGEAGEPFDPERHDAIAVRPAGDVPDNTVIEVLRAGYAIGDRVLRPAQVVVARSGDREA